MSPQAINASGQIAGLSKLQDGLQSYTIIDVVTGLNGAGPLTDFGNNAGTLGGTASLGINDAGQVAATQVIDRWATSVPS